MRFVSMAPSVRCAHWAFTLSAACLACQVDLATTAKPGAEPAALVSGTHFTTPGMANASLASKLIKVPPI